MGIGLIKFRPFFLISFLQSKDFILGRFRDYFYNFKLGCSVYGTRFWCPEKSTGIKTGPSAPLCCIKVVLFCWKLYSSDV